MGEGFAPIRGSMLKNEILRPGVIVEIGNAHPPKIGIVVSEARKMFMVGETVLVLTDGHIQRYLKDRLRIIGRE